MADIIQQLLDLKEWSQNPERYERRLNFRGAGLVQPGPEGVRQGFYKKGMVKQQPTAEDVEMAKKFYKKPFHKLDTQQQWRIKNKGTTGYKKLGDVRRQKIIEFLKSKKQIHSIELREFLAKLPGGYEGQRPSELRQKKWFKDLNIKYIQDPNPMFTGEKRGRANIPKARKTVYNKYAELFHKNQPKTYLSSNWDKLPYEQRQDIATIARHRNYKFKAKYSRQIRFNPTKEKKLMDVFGLTEQNFLDHGKHGVKKMLTKDKQNPAYTKIYNYVQNDFKFPEKDVLDISTQRKIMNTFELPEGLTEWRFKEYRYGLPYTSGKHMNLGKRIANSLREARTWKLATDWSKTKGWMMNSMFRAFENDMRLPNGQLAYEPKYETIDGKKRIIGFTDHTAAGGGKTYYGLKKWDKIHKGAEWASHGDFKKTSKFVDITKKAFAQPNEVMMGLLEKGGMPRNGRLQLNHVLKFLAQQEGYDITRIKNAIVKHHMGGVGARKMIGNPTNDLQILRFTVNNAIKKIENNIRKGIYLKDDITELKNYGASVRGPDGKLYGGGSRTATGGFKAVEKYATSRIEKWKPEDFNKFKKFTVEAFRNANIPCIKDAGGQCNTPEDFKKGFNELVQKGAVGDKAAVSKLQKFTNVMRKLKGPLKWTSYGLLAEIGFMVPFAAGDYAAGESWKRIIGNAADWGFGPMFGQSEEEEIIANLPEDSLGEEAQIAQAASERLEALRAEDKIFPKARIGMDPNRFQDAQTRMMEEATSDYDKSLAPFMVQKQPGIKEFSIDLGSQAMRDWATAQEQIKADKLRRIEERQESGILAQPNWLQPYAGGGIASIRRPNAIPPVSGPVPQGGGLSSQFNRVKKLME